MSAGRVLLAIPAFNEEATIDRVLTAVRPHGLPVLVLDDGSTDGTAARLAQHRVEVIRHRVNRGYGRAMQDIFRAADADGYGWVITMDCDEQHCPSSIPDFLRAIRDDRCDVASGSRYLRPEAPGDDAPGDDAPSGDDSHSGGSCAGGCGRGRRATSETAQALGPSRRPCGSSTACTIAEFVASEAVARCVPEATSSRSHACSFRGGRGTSGRRGCSRRSQCGRAPWRRNRAVPRRR